MQCAWIIAMSLGVGSNDAGDANSAAKAKPAAHGNGTANPQSAGSASHREGDRGGVVIVGDRCVCRWGVIAVSNVCVDAQCHAQGIKAGSEICRRGRHPDDHERSVASAACECSISRARAARALPESSDSAASGSPSASVSTMPLTTNPAALFSNTMSRWGP